ncbi:MAG TPA: exodeoxyribonuclease VII large subunit [Bacteroidales bacterium]|nr:MAG: exodeoxyribonuclease VII large subunit [Bacteroidetes bacterium GWF2_33_38]OFY76176.1 MAG: exodeoxyribonuclease VII large subunit [Bacteroidetes bacterium RIFOXYA12_FULL_33_9]OFY90542.1 MAG: exodeoxyribonuclease VII large subunit [Bacteroidetes bacterium RIFOXYA2_FULL_33_7]HBF88110.1 exodeoxyribonuclease VII large subunit [Bacteroidales bacterium]
MAENAITLSVLHEKIQSILKSEFDDSTWIVAEISELKVNQSGHCYLELIEKDPHSEKILAKAKATIWAYTFRMLKPYFETTSGYEFLSGIKILVKINIEFHAIYGYSLNVSDIDPTYTLGDIEKRRIEIITRLKNEGVIEMNKELLFPTVPKNIAIISTETAAGYGDFVNQLNNNEFGYAFHHKLFPAFMQGEQVETSILKAFDKIFQHDSIFDVVVIIRGGGSKSDLSWFDNYWIAYTVTQFPIPVLTGIGHEQDDTITDLVAHKKLKTPTAAADFLISKYYEFEENLGELETFAYNHISEKINYEKASLNNVINKVVIGTKDNIFNTKQIFNSVQHNIMGLSHKFLSNNEMKLDKLPQKITYKTTKAIDFSRYRIDELLRIFSFSLKQKIENQKHKLETAENTTELLNSDNLLKKGYSITSQNGKIIRDINEIELNAEIETVLYKGRIKSKIMQTKK